MTKRKTTATTTPREEDGKSWTGRPAAKTPKPEQRPAAMVSLRCVWHTRVVIEPTHTLSGMRYKFDAGEVRGVRKVDEFALLALEKVQPASCCGPGGTPVLKYFERA